MNTVVDDQEPEIVNETLSSRVGDVNFSLPAVKGSIYYHGILNLKVFIMGFALSSHTIHLPHGGSDRFRKAQICGGAAAL